MLGVAYLTASIEAAVREHAERTAYREYHTDLLYMISSALGNIPGARFRDIIKPEPKEERNGAEIVADRLDRFGIKVVD